MRSLRNRLALIFGLIVMAAIGIVYFSTLPQLEDRLQNQKVDSLKADATSYARRFSGLLSTKTPDEQIDDRVRRVAAQASVDINVLGRVEVARGKPSLFWVADSTPNGGLELEDLQTIAQAALITRRPAQGTEQTPAGRQAIAAQPILVDKRAQYVTVVSDSLADAQANVSLIRNRILVSGAIALVIALLAGYAVAGALAARVKRLERAARKVAAGDFSEPIEADSEDELGQLAAAFNDMQRQLARLDTARKQFIASASHELRTPIFSLGGFLELLEDEELDEATRAQFFAQVRDQVERLRTLATELLDLSRLESGALELRPEPTDVGELTREIAGEFTPAVVRRGSRLDVRLYNEPLEIECDPERVAQVLRILLDNAIVHTPAGTGITVSTARENGHVLLEVADTGPGIGRQNMPHIFEPFYTSNDAEGSGLGLAIARELAERMHGHLTVRSVPGRTSFALELPG